MPREPAGKDACPTGVALQILGADVMKAGKPKKNMQYADSTAAPPGPPADPLPESAVTARLGLEIFLRQATGFRLALALYNDPVVRDALIRSLAAELAPAGLRVLTLDLREPSPERTLLARVQALLAAHPPAPGQRLAVMLVNLESCVDYSPELARRGGPGTAFLETANLHRDLFQTACPAPLVIWMTELLERAFAQHAPDLWHWRSHVFDLRTRTGFDATMSPQRPSLANDDFRRHPEDRLRRLEEELVAYRKAGSRKDEARVLNAIGIARLDAGDARMAGRDFEAALSLYRQLGDRRGEGNAIGNLGLAHADLGDARRAIAFYEKQLVIVREIGDRRGEGNALENLGSAFKDLGDARQGIAFYEQSLAIAREIGDRRGEGITLGNLGLAHAALGNARQAIAFYEQQLVIAREIGDQLGEGNALGNLGLAYAALGDVRQAIVSYEQQLDIVREIGDRRGEAAALGNLGNANNALGDAHQAIVFYGQALVIAREIGDQRGEGNALWNSALAYEKLGDRAQALARAKSALQIREAIEDPNAPKVRAKLAEWRAAAGQ